MTIRCAKYILPFLGVNCIILFAAFVGRENFDLVTWLSIFQVIFVIATIGGYKKDCLLVVIIFVALTYLFHFGQSLITTLNFADIYAHRNVMSKTSYESFLNAEIFAMINIFFIGFAYLFSNRREDYSYQLTNLKDNLEKESGLFRVRNAALAVLVISCIPMFYIDIQKVLVSSVGSYLDTYAVYAVGIAKYMQLIGQFGRPAISLLIYSFRNEEKTARWLLILSTIYYVAMMASGDRGTYLVYIITDLFVYFKFIRKIKMKHIVMGLGLVYLLLAFLSAISLFRYSEFSIDSFADVLARRAKDGIIYSCLREFGGTMLSLVYAFDFIPSYSDYNYGLTYLAGLLTIPPKIPTSWAATLTNSFTFVRAFPEANQDSLGGSFLGELYYNFGWFGCVGSLAIGKFIAYVDKKLDPGARVKSAAIMIVLLPSLILWVRDFYCSLWFKTIWFAILLWLV